MIKSTSVYWSTDVNGEKQVEIIVNHEAKNSDHVQVKFFQERWRTKKETVKFFEWVIQQVKELPSETN